MKRITLTAIALLTLSRTAGCGGDGLESQEPNSVCTPACMVAMDNSWAETQTGVYTRSVVGSIGDLRAGQICAATLNDQPVAGSWLVEDPGAWTQDYANAESPQSYMVQTNARIGKVSTPIACQ